MRWVLASVMVFGLAGCTCGGGKAAALPTGFSQVLATTAMRDGIMPSLVLDEDELPMLAYLQEASGSPRNWRLYFTRFDGQTAAWTVPVAVQTDLGALIDNPTRQSLWLARDPKDGRLGLTFLKHEAFCGDANSNKETTVHVTFSTDQGKTWSASQRVSEAKYTRNDPVNGVEVCDTHQPRIAMRDGVVHLAWAATAGEAETPTNFYRGYYYASSTSGGPWTRTLLPPAGDDARRGTKGILSLALDASGAPGVAYLMGAIGNHPTTPNMEAVLFVRPGSAAVRAGDSSGIQNDAPQLALGFDGTKPRIAAHLARANTAGANTNWVFASPDGAAFSMSQLPDDAEDRGAQYLDIGFVGGKGVVIFDFSGGGSPGACGGPKLARSTDGTTWTTCGVDTQTRQFLGEYVTAELTSTGKLITAFYEDTADSAGRFGAGIVLYVEP
jgi:hypothetical protein